MNTIEAVNSDTSKLQNTLSILYDISKESSDMTIIEFIKTMGYKMTFGDELICYYEEEYKLEGLTIKVDIECNRLSSNDSVERSTTVIRLYDGNNKEVDRISLRNKSNIVEWGNSMYILIKGFVYDYRTCEQLNSRYRRHAYMDTVKFKAYIEDLNRSFFMSYSEISKL